MTRPLLFLRAFSSSPTKPTVTTATAAKTTTETAASTATASTTEAPSSQQLQQSQHLSPMAPMVGNLAYVALASGFLMTDMLSLRLLLVGGYSGLVAFHMLHTHPLKIPLRWSALFVLVNAGAAAFLLADQWMEWLSVEEQDLYHAHFSMLSPGQFAQLLALARTETLSDGTALTEEGQVAKNLYFIIKGRANVYLKEHFVARNGAGSFVNDVAFQQGHGASAYGTVVTQGNCSVLVWEETELRALLQKKPAMMQAMKYCFASHLVKGLLEQRDAAHLTSGQWNKYQVPSFLPRQTKAWQSVLGRRNPTESDNT